ATNPAKIFGLYPRKGTIAVGSDADLVLFDPRRTETIDERTLHSRAGYDPFHAFKITGVPVATISRGEIIARDGKLLSQAGRGQPLLGGRGRGWGPGSQRWPCSGGQKGGGGAPGPSE